MLGSAPPPASSQRDIRVTPVTPGWPPEPDVPPRGWRSAHTSGDSLDPASPLPNPRVLTNSLSHGHSSDPHSQGSSEDQVRPDVSVSNAFIICSPLYDPIIILVMELILLRIFHALSISHLTLRASPQIRLLSQVQSLWPSLTVTRLFQSEDSSPLSQSCVASAQTIPSHPPAKTVSIVDYYSQVGHPSQSQGKALESS